LGGIAVPRAHSGEAGKFEAIPRPMAEVKLVGAKISDRAEVKLKDGIEMLSSEKKKVFNHPKSLHSTPRRFVTLHFFGSQLLKTRKLCQS
jgi:hypothetical protein